MATRLFWRHILLCAVIVYVSGCAAQPWNPSFPVTTASAELDLKRMAEAPKALPRPLVVIGGFMDPGVAALTLEHDFVLISTKPKVVAIGLGECCTLDDCRRKIIDIVSVACGADDTETAEVDVVGCSLGGLAARYAAVEESGNPHARRLHIARLFTISSPHLGAEDAQRLPLLHPMQKDLRPHSALLDRLNAVKPDYPIYSYVRLGDHAVGTENAAPPGQTPWWLPIQDFSDPHGGAFLDARILADISRRLRGETPLTISPPAVVPENL